MTTNPMKKLAAVQNSMMEVMFKYLRDEIDERECSEQMDEVIEEHKYLNTIREDMDYYYSGVVA